jgi:hypothetical protein
LTLAFAIIGLGFSMTMLLIGLVADLRKALRMSVRQGPSIEPLADRWSFFRANVEHLTGTRQQPARYLAFLALQRNPGLIVLFIGMFAVAVALPWVLIPCAAFIRAIFDEIFLGSQRVLMAKRVSGGQFTWLCLSVLPVGADEASARSSRKFRCSSAARHRRGNSPPANGTRLDSKRSKTSTTLPPPRLLKCR